MNSDLHGLAARTAGITLHKDELDKQCADAFVKHDAGKPRMELIPPDALTAIAEVLTHGALKYSPGNWAKGADWSRYLGAALRHINAWNYGEDTDSESGLNHLAHAATCLCFLLAYQTRGLGTDDRQKG